MGVAEAVRLGAENGLRVGSIVAIGVVRAALRAAIAASLAASASALARACVALAASIAAWFWASMRALTWSAVSVGRGSVGNALGESWLAMYRTAAGAGCTIVCTTYGALISTGSISTSSSAASGAALSGSAVYARDAITLTTGADSATGTGVALSSAIMTSRLIASEKDGDAGPRSGERLTTMGSRTMTEPT